MNYALVTGVSSGIGKATAVRLLERGMFVFGSARKEEDCVFFLSKWPNTFKPLIFDSTDYAAIDKAVSTVESICGNTGLSLLVNNAGMAKYGPMQFVKVEDIRHQFEVNLFSVVYITQKLLRLLGGEKDSKLPKGKIITISSTAGVFTRPILGPYSSSKHALEAVFDAFRRELSIYGIKVILIQPGPIKTEIWNKVDRSENPYKETVYEKMFDRLSTMIEEVTSIALPVEKVVDVIWKAYCKEKPKPRYLVAPKYLFFWLLLYVFPASLTDKILIKEIKKYQN